MGESRRIYIDGRTLIVPVHADCAWAARGALGLQRGEGVAFQFESRPGDLLSFSPAGFEFHDGDRFVTVPRGEPPSEGPLTIYVDGVPVSAPREADCHWAARGVLGVPRGLAVAFEHEPGVPLSLEEGCFFEEGECFVTRDFTEIARGFDGGDPPADENATLDEAELENDTPRDEPWATDPDAWKLAGDEE